MGAFPTSPRSAFLDWCVSHAVTWEAQEGNIGLTAPQAAEYQAAVAAAQAAANAQQSARDAARAATTAATDAFADLRRINKITLSRIRTFAESTDNPNVYVLAQIPAPGPSVPVPPPAQPTGVTVGLDATSGAIELKWKASNPAGAQGTSYIIRRRTTPTSEFAFLGATGLKRFVDNTFFAGPDSVQYTIQGQRADSAGPVSAIITVNFGRAPGGGFAVTSVTGAQAEDASVKLAA